MAKPTSQDNQNKNVIAGSEVNAQGNVHIGDVHHHPTEVIVQSPPNSRRKLILSVLLLLAALLVAGYLVNTNILPGKNMETNDGVKPVPSPNEPKTAFDEKRDKSTGHLLPNRERPQQVSVGTADPVLQTESNPISTTPPNKIKDIKAFLKGPVARIPGNETIKPFDLNMFEVTVERYYMFCKIEKQPFPHNSVDTLNLDEPMRYVTWAEADKYCRYVGGRLPTTVEWDWAARQGAGSDLLSDAAKATTSWNRENSKKKLHPVGKKPPLDNLKLYDMFGNVEEWCDGGQGGIKFTKGGNYYSLPHNLNLFIPDNDGYSWAGRGSEVVGFRVAYDLKQDR